MQEVPLPPEREGCECRLRAPCAGATLFSWEASPGSFGMM